ncbi:FAD-binding oxidoreductase [Streptomyces sp. NPDC086783]|uniref:FAD-binding oxidoreductase n=1 Tax=Streptomyces sp. NPDC086783 TaxID=3365758 RepID=UPI00381692DE
MTPERRDAISSRDVSIPDVTSTGTAISQDALHALLHAAGGERHVYTDTSSKLFYIQEKLKFSSHSSEAIGAVAAFPQAVVTPLSHTQVVAILRACEAHNLAVITAGAGAMLAADLALLRTNFIIIDFRLMNALTELDVISRTATLQPGLSALAAEALLNADGYTLGAFAALHQHATLGGIAATRLNPQLPVGRRSSDELIIGLTLATAEGTLQVHEGRHGGSAPGLQEIIIGSEGALGVITSVTFRIQPVPQQHVYEEWRFSSFTEGIEALRRCAQNELRPDFMRLFDETATWSRRDVSSREFHIPRSVHCLAVVGYEGKEQDVAVRRRTTTSLMRSNGATRLGEVSESRYGTSGLLPYLSNPMPNTSASEILEATAFWSNIPDLSQLVRIAIERTLTAIGVTGLVTCDLSGASENGASLSFAVVNHHDPEPIRHWAPIRNAAYEAILLAGGSITRNHRLGKDHCNWFERENGRLAIEIFKAIKLRLDPHSRLNPAF